MARRKSNLRFLTPLERARLRIVQRKEASRGLRKRELKAERFERLGALEESAERRKVMKQLAALKRTETFRRRVASGFGRGLSSFGGSIKQSLSNVRRGQLLRIGRQKQLQGLKQFRNPIKPRTVIFEGQRYQVQPKPISAREEMDLALKDARRVHEGASRFGRRII